jgi:hypothetical protein
VGLERGPLSLVSTIEELLERKCNSSDLGNREYGRGDPLRWRRDILCQELVLTSPTSGGRSVGTVVGTVRSRSKTKELLLFIFIITTVFLGIDTNYHLHLVETGRAQSV